MSSREPYRLTTDADLPYLTDSAEADAEMREHVRRALGWLQLPIEGGFDDPRSTATAQVHAILAVAWAVRKVAGDG